MILCILGTHTDPFDRAVDALLQARGEEELVIQHGATRPRPSAAGATWHEFIPYEEVTNLVESADVVVCHAGVGTLLTAISHGRVPVAIPRLRSHGEHVDDHQVEIAKELGAAGFVIPWLGEGDLRGALALSRGAKARERSFSRDLRRAAISAAGGRPDLAERAANA